MEYHYYLVAYFEFAEGQIKTAREDLMYSGIKADLEELKKMIKTLILRNEAAVVVVLNVQELSEQQYLDLGGPKPRRY